jgi:hypothetical protein
MAKIKPAGGPKRPTGPKQPGAVSCLILIALILVVLGITLYYSIARG